MLNFQYSCLFCSGFPRVYRNNGNKTASEINDNCCVIMDLTVVSYLCFTIFNSVSFVQNIVMGIKLLVRPRLVVLTKCTP